MSRFGRIAKMAGKVVGKVGKSAGKRAAKAGVSAVKKNMSNLKVGGKKTFKAAKDDSSVKLSEAKSKAQLANSKRQAQAKAYAERKMQKTSDQNARDAQRLELRKKAASQRLERNHEFKTNELRSRAKVRDKWRQNLEVERHHRAMGRENRRNIKAETRKAVAIKKAGAEVREERGKKDPDNIGRFGGTTIVSTGDRGGGLRDAMLMGAVLGGQNNQPSEPPQATDGGNGQGGISININNADNAGSQKESSWNTSRQNSSQQSSGGSASNGVILPGTNNGSSLPITNKPGASGTGISSSIRLA